jgi:hypothetical protein
MEPWKHEVLAEVARETLAQHPLAKVRFVEFVSRSNGRNRPPRKEREIRLVSNNGRTIQLGSKLTRNLEFLMKGVYPQALQPDQVEDPLSVFLKALREVKRFSKK